MVFTNELAKIVRQIRGTENMFDYKNTTANQLYLLYCFCGKIFFTDKISVSIRCMWIVLHLSGMLLGNILGIMYVVQDMEKTVWTHLNVLNFVAISIFLGLYIPIILYHYAADIESTIDKIDHLLTERLTRNCNINVTRIVASKLAFTWACGAIYMSAGIFDVLIFYEEEKLKNYIYYTYPFPKLEQYGNMRFFLVSNIFCNVIFGFLLFEWMAAAAFIIVWAEVCCNGMESIKKRVESRTKVLTEFIANNQMSKSQSWRMVLKASVINGTNAFERITSIIDNSRRFIEFLYSIAVLGSFFGEAIQIYVILSTDVPFSMKLKGISYLTGLGWTIFLLFWIGEALQSAVSNVSFSVYSTPWYWSAKNRQDVQIFLNQTQKLDNLSILRVYPLRCRTFSQYLHGILTYVNFLRNVTKK